VIRASDLVEHPWRGYRRNRVAAELRQYSPDEYVIDFRAGPRSPRHRAVLGA
jgi:hypothetical protein